MGEGARRLGLLALLRQAPSLTLTLTLTLTLILTFTLTLTLTLTLNLTLTLTLTLALTLIRLTTQDGRARLVMRTNPALAVRTLSQRTMQLGDPNPNPNPNPNPKP